MHSDPHQRARFLIDEAAIAGIASDDQRWLRTHTEDCAECARYAEVTSRIVRGLNALSCESDPAMTVRVQASLAAHAQRPRHAPPWRVALIAAALLIAVAPIYKNFAEKRRQAELEKADTLLLERVDARLSQTLPEAMEPLTQAAPGGRIR
jgi:hypothetical protein